MSEMSDRLLEWCKMIDQRLWQSQHVLRHFCYPPGSANSHKGGKSLDEGPKGGVLKEQIVKKLEDANFDYWTVLNMTVSELTNITGTKDWGRAVDKYMRPGAKQLESRKTWPGCTVCVVAGGWCHLFGGLEQEFQLHER
eukprot:Skav226435  [mRNA]  locus=scaffold696:290806:294622:+ [translate_table: standard]